MPLVPTPGNVALRRWASATRYAKCGGPYFERHQGVASLATIQELLPHPAPGPELRMQPELVESGSKFGPHLAESNPHMACSGMSRVWTNLVNVGRIRLDFGRTHPRFGGDNPVPQLAEHQPKLGSLAKVARCPMSPTRSASMADVCCMCELGTLMVHPRRVLLYVHVHV